MFFFSSRRRHTKYPFSSRGLGVLYKRLVYFAGFSHIEAVHNAAHDTRHSAAFPCH
ncbi:CbtB domain-containing protein [Pseudomonas carnis]|uniref:CbtB domain-containing protein n=1 Tax=Pseudomonas carnis TaxID=2487355 RepID=UPI003AFFC258